MTMDMGIDGAVPLDSLAEDRTVRIGLGRVPNGDYRIVAVEAAGRTPWSRP
jgi:hypothetical protein